MPKKRVVFTFDEHPTDFATMTPIKAIDVCCGAGGWAVAARGLPIEIVAAFDRAPDALATYKLNHPTVECIECDVMSYDFSPWRGVNLILGGIPCETLSTARSNYLPSREELNAFKALLSKFLSLPPKLGAKDWCYEEVPQVLKYLPKGTPYLDLNSEHWSAQRRRRFYIGNLAAPPSADCPDVLKHHLRPGPHRLSPRIHGVRTPTTDRRGENRPNTFYPCEPEFKCVTVQPWGDSKRDADYAVMDNGNPRQWDWKEAATLQGFPVDYTFVGNPGRVAKMVGQAVQIDTARALLAHNFSI